MTKITNKEVFNAILACAVDCTEAFASMLSSLELDVSVEDVENLCAKQVETLEKKAATAKAKAAEKKAAGDELRDRVFEVLTDEYMSIADVTALIGDEEVSTNKVAYRLNALVDLGMAVKAEAKVPASEGGKARTIKVFARAQ